MLKTLTRESLKLPLKYSNPNKNEITAINSWKRKSQNVAVSPFLSTTTSIKATSMLFQETLDVVVLFTAMPCPSLAWPKRPFNQIHISAVEKMKNFINLVHHLLISDIKSPAYNELSQSVFQKKFSFQLPTIELNQVDGDDDK